MHKLSSVTAKNTFKGTKLQSKT